MMVTTIEILGAICVILFSLSARIAWQNRHDDEIQAGVFAVTTVIIVFGGMFGLMYAMVHYG